MGYYSQYEVIVHGGADIVEVAEELYEISNYSTEIYDGKIVLDGKWYSHALDMVFLSEQFPGVLFQMTAVGEDGDRWQVFARDGKSYSENVTPSWPAVDESRLV